MTQVSESEFCDAAEIKLGDNESTLLQRHRGVSFSIVKRGGADFFFLYHRNHVPHRFLQNWYNLKEKFRFKYFKGKNFSHKFSRGFFYSYKKRFPDIQVHLIK